ncbi:MAG: phasin family protein [Nitrospirae bacterium]|nr:phasin family protein [Nitrospirota bacterium]
MMFDIVRKAMLAGFGVQEKVNEFVNDLVAKGELSNSEGAKLVKEWSAKAEKTTEDVTKTVDDLVKSAVEKISLATKEDIEKLNRKIQALSSRVKKLEEAAAGSEGGEEQSDI